MSQSNDILQSAESQAVYQTKFYWLAGEAYTGDIPYGGSYGYGSAIVFKRGGNSIFIIVISVGKPIYNSKTGTGWNGWKYFDGTNAS